MISNQLIPKHYLKDIEKLRSIEEGKAMASSDGQLVPRSDTDSPLSYVLYDLSQKVQGAIENMLKMSNEIDQNSAGIMEEIEKCKESAMERKNTLEEEKDHFQKAAYTVLDLLNNRDIR